MIDVDVDQSRPVIRPRSPHESVPDSVSMGAIVDSLRQLFQIVASLRPKCRIVASLRPQYPGTFCRTVYSGNSPPYSLYTKITPPEEIVIDVDVDQSRPVIRLIILEIFLHL